ncbi:response regulator [Saccharomonospora xinjiangensis]|uniref:Response regulator containing a CheY-like receiver domain and an HTH DNA-binding domain n=1 Tax=Saccharomonospora xinjiangensis XJ-54 TaxID=882086 RepID=I0V0L7_9PSEU|nr:response regulator transcription factor [Saccharomonospora xinjiangensis]EID53670.1 response regulator containing a CheY-like receiver domain and an HTH DNA-binding domain [Saccharomonospora xinjiangensis XJ-54]
MIRILLADDHPVVRAGLRAVLETEPGFVIVDEAATAEEAVQRCAEIDVDVVLMDLRFGAGTSGIDATSAIRSRPDPPHVVVLTTYDTDADILAALDAGAAGYLLKDTPPDELASAVRSAAVGRAPLSPAVAGRLLDRMRTPTRLSPRETEVLSLVALGLSNQLISRKLFLTEATVKSHLAHIYGKLGVGSRTAAVAVATERGIIRAPHLRDTGHSGR